MIVQTGIDGGGDDFDFGMVAMQLFDTDIAADDAKKLNAR